MSSDEWSAPGLEYGWGQEEEEEEVGVKDIADSPDYPRVAETGGVTADAPAVLPWWRITWGWGWS